MRKNRHWLGGSALAALGGLMFAACGGPSGCDSPSPGVAMLEFRGPNNDVLASRISGLGQTAQWDALSFGPILTDVPISDVSMQFRGIDGRVADAYAFAQDLGPYHRQLQTAAIESAEQRVDALQLTVGCEPQRVVRLTWDGSDTTQTTGLDWTHFWSPFNPGEPCGDASSPDGEGSVKSAVIYDRGECGFIEDDLAGILRDTTRQTWNSVESLILDNDFFAQLVDRVDRHVTRSASYVTPGPEGATDVRGGFVFAVSTLASMQNLSPINDLTIDGPTTSSLGSMGTACSTSVVQSFTMILVAVGCSVTRLATRPFKATSAGRLRASSIRSMTSYERNSS